MKTYEQWEESNLDWLDFFKPLDEIDEQAFMHVIECVPPQFTHLSEQGYFGQNGEAQCDEKGITFRDTVWQPDVKVDKYYYLGLLPQFRKWKANL